MRSARASSLALAVPCACVALASCDLSGLTGGVTDGGVEDAPGAGDAPAVDGSTRADAGSDALADAPGDAGIDAPPFCASQTSPPTFCADFDESTNAAAGWTNANESNGTVALDRTHFASPPACAQCTSGPVNALSSAQASLEYDTGTSGTHVHLELMTRFAQIDPNARMKTAGFEVGGASPVYTIYVIVGASNAWLEESIVGDGGQTFRDTPLSKVPTVGEWQLLQLDVVLPMLLGPAATATVRLGPDTVLSAQPLYGGGATGKILMSAGLEVYPDLMAIGPSQVEIDDVLLTVKP